MPKTIVFHGILLSLINVHSVQAECYTLCRRIEDNVISIRADITHMAQQLDLLVSRTRPPLPPALPPAPPGGPVFITPHFRFHDEEVRFIDEGGVMFLGHGHIIASATRLGVLVLFMWFCMAFMAGRCARIQGHSLL